MGQDRRTCGMDKMYRVLKGMLVICAVFAVMLLLPNSANAASKSSLKKKLQNKTSQTIYIFRYADLDRHGTKEAVALTADSIDEYGGYFRAKLWYISDKKCYCFYSSSDLGIYNLDFEGDMPMLWKVKNAYLFKVEVGAYGSGSMSLVWRFTKKGARKVKVPGMDLIYRGNNKFYISDSAFDAMSDGTGHTWKRYYLYWNGKKFIEYGGIRITETQLQKAKGASAILKAIRKKGRIQKIYYRSNGIININYRDYTTKTDWINYNVTLKLKGKKVTYDTSIYPSGKTKLDKATDSGVYGKAISRSAKYPKNFL